MSAPKALTLMKVLMTFLLGELKENVRPIDTTVDGIVSPSDGIICQLGQIDNHKLLQAKGRYYDVGQLLADSENGSFFADGSFATVCI